MNERIKDMANKGLITKVVSENDFEKLSKLSEKELIDLGYMTQTSIFDGNNETIEEDAIEIPVEDDAPVVDDEHEPMIDDVQNTSVIDPEDLPSDVIETPEEEEGEL